jgi:hypothetical protein
MPSIHKLQRAVCTEKREPKENICFDC